MGLWKGRGEVVMQFALLLCVSSLSQWKLETRKVLYAKKS